MPLTDSYDIATERFKSMVDSYVSSLTITQEEIDETERTNLLMRGLNGLTLLLLPVEGTHGQ